MTKPTTESGAPIEFTLRGYKFRLCLEQWSDGGSREFGWAHGERAAAEHLVAAMQANPELRAQVLDALVPRVDPAVADLRRQTAARDHELLHAMLQSFREMGDLLLVSPGSNLHESVPRAVEKRLKLLKAAETELAKCRAELERLRQAIAFTCAQWDGFADSDSRDAVASTYRACIGRLNSAIEDAAAPATEDQEAAAVEPAPPAWIPALGATVRFKGIAQTYTVRGTDANDMTALVMCDDGNAPIPGWVEIDSLEPAPPEAPKLQGGLGPVDALRADIVAGLRKVDPDGWRFNQLADELERGRQR